MLLIRRIEITNFVCFDRLRLFPSTDRNKPLTVVRAENGSGKTTLLRAIRWGMYGERGLPGNPAEFSLHPASWEPDAAGVETRVSILFETDGSTRHHPESGPATTEYELHRSVTTLARSGTETGDPDYHRVNESTQLLVKEEDGWMPYEHGVDSMIRELLPWELRDFFVMDADEAADFVGGSENKSLRRQDVIAKTSYAVRSLLGLEVFEEAAGRIRSIEHDLGRQATKAARDHDLDAKQDELDGLRQANKALEERVERNRKEKTDIDDDLAQQRGQLEARISRLGAHDELLARKKEHEERILRARADRREAAVALSNTIGSVELLAALASREIAHVCHCLQPLYDDGTIPVRHLAFVEGLLDQGTCVCGQDLTAQGEHRDKIRRVLADSRVQVDRADYLTQVLQAARALHSHRDGDSWMRRREDLETTISARDDELGGLVQSMRDIESKLSTIKDQGIEAVRGQIEMLETRSENLERDLIRDRENADRQRQEIGRLEGVIRRSQRGQTQARDLQRQEETASLLAQIIRNAQARIRDDQVAELGKEMNRLFLRMAANVMDDDGMEDDRPKAKMHMIEQVGLTRLEQSEGDYEIFALNSRGRSMPPTEINGASRRILALSFVLALCKVSRTLAPLVADSMLNFMSGAVRTNTVRITAETANQPILLLTGSDLEAQSEVDLISRYAGATYTLTAQWQHTDHGGDVVNLTDARKVSLLCPCGPRQYCKVCERAGQAANPAWQPR